MRIVLAVMRKLWPLALFLIIWEAACYALRLPAYILPPPHRVLQRLIDKHELLYQHSLVSMLEILAGFVIAGLCGFLCAVAMVHSRRLELALEPFLVISQVIPKVALAPLFIIWFGHGIEPKIIIAMLISFFPVLVNSALGLRAIDGEILELMDSIAATKLQLFWRVRLPNSLPYVLPSLKVAALLSVVGAMVGEFVGSDQGLGYLMVVSDVNLDTDLLFAALVIVTLLGLVLYSGMELLERGVARRYGPGADRAVVTL